MELAKTAVALGIFDGVHLGHQAVLKLAAEQMKNGLEPCAVTFSPSVVSLKKAIQDLFSERPKKYGC